MAKLTDVPIVTALDGADLIYGVDVSDATDDPAGSSVAITKADFQAGLGGGGAVNPTPAKVLLQEIELSTAGEFDFTDIPSGYDRLIIEGYIETNTAGPVGVPMYFNGDTNTANYNTQLNSAYNGSTQDVEIAGNSLLLASPSSIGPASTQTVIENYAGSKLKNALTTSTGYGSTVDAQYATIRVTSHTTMTTPITRLTTVSGNTITGKLQLFGERAVSIEASETVTTKIQVATITDPVSGSFDFDLTDYQDGDRIIIEGSLRGEVAQATEEVLCYLNGDTTPTNYSYLVNGAFDSSSSANPNIATGAAARTGTVPAGTSPAGAYSTYKARIEDGFGGQKKLIETTYVGEYQTDDQTIGLVSTTSSVTAPVTSISFIGQAGTLEGTLTCYIEKQNVMPQVSGGGTGEPVTFTNKELIQEIELSTAGEFDFTAIPAGYDRLIIQGSATSSTVNTADSVVVIINDRTTATDYRSQYLTADGGNVNNTQQDSNVAALCTGTTSLEGKSNLRFEFTEDYTGVGVKTCTGHFSAGRTVSQLATGSRIVSTKTSEAAVTRLRIRADGNPTDQLTGKLQLYGEKQETFVPADVVQTGSFDLPVVQSAIIEVVDSEILWSSELGWSATKTSTGQVDITFPTAAASNNDQVLSVSLRSGLSDDWTCNATAVSTTGCTVRTYASGALSDATVYITRRLPDTSVANKVVVPDWENASFDLPVVQSATYERVADGFVFTSEAGWSVVNSATGVYDVTFPTDAGTVDAQSVMAGPSIPSLVNIPIVVEVTELTSVGCKIKTFRMDTDVALDTDWTIHRRLGDTSVANKVILPTVELYHGEWVCDYAQTFTANIGTIVDYNVKLSEVGGTDQVTNGVFTAPRDGVYTFAASTSMTAGGGDSIRLYGDTLSGVTRSIRKGQGTNNTANQLGYQWHHTVTMKAGDTVNASFYPVTSAKTLDGDASHNILTVDQLATGMVTATVDPNRAGEVVKEEIARITDPVSGDFDFTVPAGYDRLIVQGHAKSNSSGTVEALTCFINEELVTSDYWYQTISAGNEAVNVNGGAVAFAGLLTTVNASPANMQTDVEVVFEAPDVANKTKSYRAMVVTGAGDEDIATGVYSTRSPADAPITRLRFRTDNHPTDQLTGTLILYGERTL